MNKIKGLIYFFVFVFVIASAQEKNDDCGNSQNKKAVKLYEKGIDKKNKKDERVLALKQAVEIDEGYVAANYALGQEMIKTLKLDGKPYKSIEPYFLKVVENCPQYHSDPYYFLGFSYYEEEKYDEAIQYLEKFIAFKDDDDKKFNKNYDGFLYQAKEMLKYAKFHREIFNNPKPFNPVAVDNVSTKYSEFLPYISPDNELMFFTRRLPFQSKDLSWSTDKEIERFSLSHRINGKYEEGKPLSSPFNKNPNEGAATISIDNLHLYYTIGKEEGGEQPNFDIYYSDNINGQWSEVKKVPGINDPKFFESQPCLAADGKTLYFVSDRPGGYGGMDIYKAVRDETGNWGKPENLGPAINTPGHDKSPFMHADSETLYFASDGRPGVGGFDIYYAKKDEKGKWLEPKNIGFPINSQRDDLGLFVSTDGTTAYFATNDASRKGKIIGGWDIYAFELYKEARPEKVAFIKGEVKTETGSPVKNAKIEITASTSKQKTEAVVDTNSGRYTAIVKVTKKDNFIIDVKKEGQAFSTQVIEAKNLDTTAALKPARVNIEVKPIKVNETYALNNVYYATNRAELKEESMIVLEKFVEFLQQNPTVKIEIHGHTDNVGSDKDNIALSTDRAVTVYSTLLKLGISKERFSDEKYKGFGATKPIASNTSEEGRAKNRRTEFLIVEK